MTREERIREEEARGRQAVYVKFEQFLNDLSAKVIREDIDRARSMPGRPHTVSFNTGVNKARSQLLAHLKKVVLP